MVLRRGYDGYQQPAAFPRFTLLDHADAVRVARQRLQVADRFVMNGNPLAEVVTRDFGEARCLGRGGGRARQGEQCEA